MEQRTSYYEGDAGEEYHRAVHGGQIQSESEFKAKSALANYRYFKDVSLDARVFEFGVGTGVNLAGLQNEVRHGYDVSEFARELSVRRGLTVFENQEDVPEGAYDFVLCRHVLEHVPNPLETLAYLASRLAADGVLLLVLPVERAGSRYQRVPEPDVNNHLFGWTLQQIVNLANSCGLRATGYEYQWYSMQVKLQRLASLSPRLYATAVGLAGRLRRQKELLVWLKARPGEKVDTV